MAETALKLTPARREVLVVLAERHARNRSGRLSSATVAAEGWIHWQPTQALIAAGLARRIRPSITCSYVRITEAGLAALEVGA